MAKAKYEIVKSRTGLVAFKCLACGRKMVKETDTADGVRCVYCGDAVRPLGYARKVPAESVPPEGEEQRQLFEWANFFSAAMPELELLYHIPNGGSRNKAEAAKLKREGVKPGVPDLCLPVPRFGFNGMYIELKRRKGGQVSAGQKRWIEKLQQQGYRAVVCRGWKEAAAAIANYLTGEEMEIK